MRVVDFPDSAWPDRGIENEDKNSTNVASHDPKTDLKVRFLGLAALSSSADRLQVDGQSYRSRA